MRPREGKGYLPGEWQFPAGRPSAVFAATMVTVAILATAALLSCVVVPETRIKDPVAVPKSIQTPVYVHMMPWFETPESSANGNWGIHWTMNTRNPQVIDGSGKRQIASHYYPLIGPYASSDPDVVEYQLLLMKYAGADGVLIDWPGTVEAWDYPANRRNAEIAIAKTTSLGLGYAIVYEDHNIALSYDAGFISDKMDAALGDMVYLENRYFPDTNYIRFGGRPLLLDFGPQTFQAAADWTGLFSVFTVKPAFLTLWYESGEAGSNADGEYSWIYSDFLNGLKHFYDNRNVNIKFGSAYPGFVTYYEDGGWDGPGWSISHQGMDTFESTLDLALLSGVSAIQIATWNDYGEGTMIEPTKEFQYGFLTILQDRLGVPFGQNELELIGKLYEERKSADGNTLRRNELDRAFYHLAALETDAAREIIER